MSIKFKKLLPLLGNEWVEITVSNVKYYDAEKDEEYTTSTMYCSRASDIASKYKDLDHIRVNKIGSCQYKDGTCVTLDCSIED
jgi:hypothetical protein